MTDFYLNFSTNITVMHINIVRGGCRYIETLDRIRYRALDICEQSSHHSHALSLSKPIAKY